MNRGPRVLALAALTAAAASFISSWAGADPVTVTRSYPDTTAGPYYMEITTNLLDPAAGSGWAFGMLTTCSVPHVASVYFWASANPGYPPTVYSGDGTTSDYFEDTGGSPTIAQDSFVGWSPPASGDAIQTYLPTPGDDGVRGDPTYVTVPKNWSQAYAGQDLTDTDYQVGIGITALNYFYCTECGDGCPPP